MSQEQQYDIAILGATGLVGEALLDILQERNFPIRNIYLLASERSAGKQIRFRGKTLVVKDVEEFDFSLVQIAFFSAGAKVSAKYAPKAAEQGCIVIDNTSQFRYEADIPLVVPEVNPDALEHYRERNIIANPNCSTIQLVVALKPIYDAVGISRINIATYQAVSGAGRRAMEELAKQIANLMNGQDVGVEVLPKQIAFNVVPQIDVFLDNGYTKEEMKIVWETHKILDEAIIVNPTTVRVPVFFGHSEAVHIETLRPITPEEVTLLLKQTPGISLFDDAQDYPTAFTDAANQDDVFVGRIRQGIDNPQGINLWVVADNVRKGAALNAIQIAELLIKQNLYLH